MVNNYLHIFATTSHTWADMRTFQTDQSVKMFTRLQGLMRIGQEVKS